MCLSFDSCYLIVVTREFCNQVVAGVIQFHGVFHWYLFSAAKQAIIPVRLIHKIRVALDPLGQSMARSFVEEVLED